MCDCLFLFFILSVNHWELLLGTGDNYFFRGNDNYNLSSSTWPKRPRNDIIVETTVPFLLHCIGKRLSKVFCIMIRFKVNCGNRNRDIRIVRNKIIAFLSGSKLCKITVDSY